MSRRKRKLSYENRHFSEEKVAKLERNMKVQLRCQYIGGGILILFVVFRNHLPNAWWRWGILLSLVLVFGLILQNLRRKMNQIFYESEEKNGK